MAYQLDPSDFGIGRGVKTIHNRPVRPMEPNQEKESVNS